jgi:hypothetical protein
MSITTGKLAPNNAAAKSVVTTRFRDANNLAAVVIRLVQVPFSFLVESITAYASAVTDAVTAIVGVVNPGTSIEGVALGIAGTVSKFKVTAAFTAVMPTKVLLAINKVVLKAIADNIAFSTAFTINHAGVAGQFWGVVRVQMDALGAVSTKVPSQDQVFTTEAYAKYQAPPADPGMFDCGTITIRSAAGVQFLAQTTALNAVGTTVNYNGAASGFRNVCSADTVFEEVGEVTFGAMQAKVADRSVSVAGGLLVVKETTDNTGSVTDGTLDVGIRAWPLDGEVAGVLT